MLQRANIWATLTVMAAAGAGLTEASALAQPASQEDVASAGAAQTEAPVAMTFPRTLALPGGRFTVYEPQILSHAGFTRIIASSAASYQPDGQAATFGTIEYGADIVVDAQNRLVTIYDREILAVQFPELDAAHLASLSDQLRANVRTQPETIPLDVMLGYVASDAAHAISIDVSFEPPAIYYASEPTLLVIIDGEPILVPVEGANDLTVVVNTNWDIFQTPSSGLYALLLGDVWLVAPALAGPWTLGQAPEGLTALPDSDRWSRVKAADPGQSMAAEDIPAIQAAAAPAELIVTNGPVELEEIDGTSLAFVANTSADIVFNAADGYYYFLTSGRWFKSRALAGEWSSVTSLPAEFSDIPAAHARAHVRASVPGTLEANLAVVQAQIPQTAEVSRETPAPEVVFAGGEAVFEKIDGADVYRATNTTFDVFRVGDSFYLCHDAIWFQAQDSDGPWRVTDALPVEIYAIPADSPSHHVTYVTVYESSPDVVYVGYTPGYHYSYVSGGVVVYGSGYYWDSYYDPYYYSHYPYYYYYPYPYSYGQASVFQVNTGTYVHGHYAYGPYGGYWEGSRYNPRTGRYGGGVYAYDYDTAVYEGWSYNPRTNVSLTTSQSVQWSGGDSYEAWGETVIQRDDAWVHAERYRTEDGFAREIESSAGGQMVQAGTNGNRVTAGQTADGEIYAGANGTVFRRTEDGEWETRSDGEWTSVDTQGARDSAQAEASARGVDATTLQSSDRASSVDGARSPSSDIQRLERDRSARTDGRSRYESFNSQRSRSGSLGGGGRRRG